MVEYFRAEFAFFCFGWFCVCVVIWVVLLRDFAVLWFWVAGCFELVVCWVNGWVWCF